MAKEFHDLRAKMSPEAQARAHEKAQTLLAELPLSKLRQARQLSQEQLAAVAKIEKKTDMYISTLRRFIEAMGGRLEICAHFPDGDVHINQFEDLDEDHKATAS